MEVDRTDPHRTRLVEETLDDASDGEVVMRVERFAVTANTITYARAGAMLGYWDFHPSGDDTWGRVPAMGWGEVIASRVPDIEVGSRYFGWYPMAQFMKVAARPSGVGFHDHGDHRAAHALVYRAFTNTALDPSYEEGVDAEGRHALLRGLFLTGFLADAAFADSEYLDADQVVVVSASSKTAIGFAQCAASQPPAVIGLTSASNAAFVESLPYYDTTVAYDDITSIEQRPTVVIDMAGNGRILEEIHDHLGDHIQRSMLVGMSHGAPGGAAVAAGPTPEMFFAPTEVEQRRTQWGISEYEARAAEALRSFVDSSREWLRVEHSSGPDAATAVWAAVIAGDVDAATGHVVSMHPGR